MVSKIVDYFWMLFVFPFLILSIYTYPNLEDYAESIIPSITNHVEFLYLTYDGRYFTSFLFAAFNPLKFNWFLGYQMLPVILIILLYGSIVCFIKAILPSIRIRFVLTVSGFVFSLFLLNNPSPSYTFYYMISSYIYILPSIFFIILTAILCKFLTIRNGWIKMIFFFLSIFLIIAIVGSNELLFAPICFLLFLFAYISSQKSNNEQMLEVFLLSIVLFVSLYISISSPGTALSLSIDFQSERGLNYIFVAVRKSILYTLIKYKEWFFSGFSFWLIIFNIIYLFKNEKVLKNGINFNVSKKVFFCWLIFFMGSSLILIFPYTWALGNMSTLAYNQIFIIPYLYFCIGLGVSIFLYFNSSFYLIPNFKNNSINKAFKYLLPIATICFVLIENNKIAQAYKDILSGDAKKYAETMQLNINNSITANENVDLCLLNTFPSTIYSGIYFNKNNESFHGQYKIFFKIKNINLNKCE